jgi:hypothetical protein
VDVEQDLELAGTKLQRQSLLAFHCIRCSAPTVGQ